MEECSYNNCLISFSYMQSSQTEVHAIYCITFIHYIWLQVKSLLLCKCETISSCCLSFAYFSKAFFQSCLPNLLLFLTLFPILPSTSKVKLVFITSKKALKNNFLLLLLLCFCQPLVTTCHFSCSK